MKINLKYFIPCFYLCLFFSCKTVDVKTERNVDFNYSDEEKIEQDLKRLDTHLKSDVLKAYWYGLLLEEKYPQNTEIENAVSDVEKKVIDKFTAAYSSSDYNEALRIYNSFEACNKDKLIGSEFKIEDLRKAAYEKIPGVNGKVDERGKKVADYIKGTVTVIVDKGIKVEHGIGMSDMVLGSGFFISENGYLVTNHHVIKDCVDTKYKGTAKLFIKISEDTETRIPAKVVGYDSTLDLALLKTEFDAPYFFTLGSSDNIDVGDTVYAIGSPLGLESTLTSGIVSSIDRQITTFGKVFQIDAAVNSGNSGGPMIDKNGRVQAVVFAGVQNYQGLNFAIPVEYLKNDLPFLFAGGERTHNWIGCYGKTKKLPGSGTENEGISVSYIMPGSFAEQSGLRVEDVIVAVNDINVKTLDDLQSEFMKAFTGSIVKISILNDNNDKKDLLVYLGKRPEYPGYSVYSSDIIQDAAFPLFGMKLAAISSNKKSFSVVQVLKGSIADEYGFAVGDPVKLNKVEINKECSEIYIEFYGKRRNNGYLEVGIGINSILDSPFYF